MKSLLFLLLAVSLGMGQDTLILKSGEQQQVRFIEIQENRVIIEIEGVGLSTGLVKQGVPLYLVNRIILEDGTVAWTSPDSGSEAAIALQDSIQFDKFYSRPKGQQNTKIAPSLEQSMAKLADAQARTATVAENYYKIYVASLILYGVLVLFVFISQ